MIRLSINLLSNMLGLLNAMKTSDAYNYREVIYYRAFSVSVDTMLEMAEKCHWITGIGEIMSLTGTGMHIINMPGYGLTQTKMRIMLSDYILHARPIWCNRIPYGRQEAVIFMSKDEKACFYEAGLLTTSLTPDVIDWWDKLSNDIRKVENEAKLITGRDGEQLTLNYEKHRTKQDPRWISIDSNLAGYDIISHVSEDDDHQLLIEVKASTEPLEYAWFYLSRNEWHVANNSSCYKFYLWSLSSKGKMLAKITPDELQEYIPINQNCGEWESVRIPFVEFVEQFQEY